MKFSSTGSWIYIKRISPAPFVASSYSTQMGSLVRDQMLPLWQRTQSLSLCPLNDHIFKNKGDSCPLRPLLRLCSLEYIQSTSQISQPLCFYFLTEGYFLDYLSTYIICFENHITYIYTLYFILCHFLE